MPILAEAGRSLSIAEVQGEKTCHIRQQWKANADESLYGLEQHQFGMLDIKGYDLELWQHNTNIVVPYLVSSKGYGIYWENISITRFGDLRPFVAIPPENLFDSDGKPGGLTVVRVDGSVRRHRRRHVDLNFKGATSEDGGDAKRRSNMSLGWLDPCAHDRRLPVPDLQQRRHPVWLDGKLMIDHWRQNWLTNQRPGQGSAHRQPQVCHPH